MVATVILSILQQLKAVGALVPVLTPGVLVGVTLVLVVVVVGEVVTALHLEVPVEVVQVGTMVQVDQQLMQL